MKRIFFLLAMAGMAEGSSIAPFSLNLSQAGGPSASAGETLISGLDFPYELAVGTDGSLLFGQTESLRRRGTDHGQIVYRWECMETPEPGKRLVRVAGNSLRRFFRDRSQRKTPFQRVLLTCAAAIRN